MQLKLKEETFYGENKKRKNKIKKNKQMIKKRKKMKKFKKNLQSNSKLGTLWESKI